MESVLNIEPTSHLEEIDTELDKRDARLVKFS